MDILLLVKTSSPGHSSTIDRIDYGNDTATASPKGNMSRSTRDQTSTGNTLFGYVSGGNGPTPGQTTTLDRIDYSTILRPQHLRVI